MDQKRKTPVAVRQPFSEKSGFRHCSDPLMKGIRKQLDQFISTAGRRPRILMGRPEGRQHDRLLKMAANYFGDLGFDVDISPEDLPPESAGAMAVDNDVHVICLTNIKEKDAHFLETIQAKLREARCENVITIAIGDKPSSAPIPFFQPGRTENLTWGPMLAESVVRLMERIGSGNVDPQTPETYINGVLARDRRMIAKTLSLIESRAAEHRTIARKVIEGLYPHSGNAVRIGVSGIPGAGKSTFIERFGLRLLEMEHRVAVLAIDPSSTISGGSLLGDKIRMAGLSADTRAFIRPSPSSGILGGVAANTREAMIVCEAAGFDVILVETVGVGQTEIVAASMVDFFLLLLVAGAGDQFQGIKKGIIEVADAIVITKADGDNILKAQASREEYTKALSLLRPESNLWRPPVVTCSVHDPKKIEAVWDIISQYVERLSNAGELSRKRGRQSVDWTLAMVDRGLKHQFRENPRVVRILDGVLHYLENGNTSAEEAARLLLDAYDASAV